VLRRLASTCDERGLFLLYLAAFWGLRRTNVGEHVGEHVVIAINHILIVSSRSN
jgi:hypothetical protein